MGPACTALVHAAREQVSVCISRSHSSLGQELPMISGRTWRSGHRDTGSAPPPNKRTAHGSISAPVGPPARRAPSPDVTGPHLPGRDAPGGRSGGPSRPCTAATRTLAPFGPGDRDLSCCRDCDTDASWNEAARGPGQHPGHGKESRLARRRSHPLEPGGHTRLSVRRTVFRHRRALSQDHVTLLATRGWPDDCCGTACQPFQTAVAGSTSGQGPCSTATIGELDRPGSFPDNARRRANNASDR